MKRIATISGQIVGIIFLLSGFAKAADSALFANILGSYGTIWFGVVSPVIILMEIILGLLLVFQIRPRQIATIATLFIVVLTIGYTYGLLFRGVTDCGCFGHIAFMNRAPWFTYMRNAIMVVALLMAIYKADACTITIRRIIYISCVSCIACFMMGFSFRNAEILKKHNSTVPRQKMLADTSLADYITVGPDSTYLVFAFSYSCPYCINSIYNIEQYERVGVVDRVIGLVAEDSVASSFFYRYFDPSFEIHELPMQQMMRFCRSLPTSFFIHGDTITQAIEGMAINPILLITHQ